MEFDTWEKFESLLYSLSEKKGQKGGRDSSPLISPARYRVDTTRSNKSVEVWGGWACLDVDDFVCSSEHLEQTLYEKFGEYYYICYSTASSTIEQPKFRLVFPLTKEVVSKDLPHFWFAMNKEFDELGDEQTKDLSRMYYVPAQYPNAYNFIFTNDGVKIDPDMLRNKHSYVESTGNTFLDRLPPAMQQAVIQHRKNSLDNTDYSWTSYRDCPFFPKRLEQEYLIFFRFSTLNYFKLLNHFCKYTPMLYLLLYLGVCFDTSYQSLCPTQNKVLQSDLQISDNLLILRCQQPQS